MSLPGRRRGLIFAILVAAFATAAWRPMRGPDCARIPPDAGCTRVLFIGNSYTYVNNLPGVFAQIGNALGRPVYADMIAPGGETLAGHAASPAVLARIRDGHWTYVVLQEQSVMPAVEPSRQSAMFPAARALVDSIRRAGAQPVFFITWGHENGWPDGGLADYRAMQTQLTLGYRMIADEMHAIAVPVGEAWRIIATKHRDIPLWQGDGSHPTVQGTFLAANVFVEVLLHVRPRGMDARGPVPAGQVNRLQQAASRAVAEAPRTTR